MHVLSKVLLGLVIVLAILAIMLTSKLRLARGHWLNQVAQRETQLETLKEDLRKKRLTVAAARDDVNRLMTLWGNAWPGANGQVVNPEIGTIAINVGGNRGLGRRELAAGSQLPAFYVFAQSPQGQETRYLGEFWTTAVQADLAAGQLTRPPLEGEVQSWPQQVTWRIRESIPSHWRAIFSGLQSRIAEALQDVQDQEARLAMADELIARSEEQRQRRLTQLDGNPNALEGSSQEVMDGLVESLRKSETSRNEDLARLDDLRHEYDRKYRQLLQLIDENRQLEESLGQPAQTAPPENGQQAIETSTQPTSRR